jgi:peptide/nickel transport system permease protein
LKDIFTGSLGDSLFRKDDILQVIGRRLPISAEIGVLSVLLAWVMGLPVGILSALRPQSASDAAASSFTVLFLAIPNFWFGMVIVLASISWFGYKSPIVSVQLWDDPWRNFQIIAGPTVVLGTGLAAVIARLARSSLMEILRDDYVRTARAKGLRERLIMVRHTLPNALLPVLTVTGLMLATVIGGSVAVEQAFTAPGLGKTLVAAMTDRDFNIVQNIVLIYCLIFVVMNLVVDILYGYLDPRIRFAE